jgi:hypothetical protein
MSFRDTLSDEDRRIWDEAVASEQANREANHALMDAHNVPRGARKGFATASLWNQNKIVEIIEYPREGGASCWALRWLVHAQRLSRWAARRGQEGRLMTPTRPAWLYPQDVIHVCTPTFCSCASAR